MSRKTRKHTLSVQQEAFAQAVAVERMLFAEAYKLAYNVKENTPQKTINEGGSRVANNPWVAARIEELRKQLGKKLEAKTLWTFEHSVAALKKAYSEGNPAVKVSAVKELNAMHGYIAPQKHQHEGKDGEPIKHDVTITPLPETDSWIAGLISNGAETPPPLAGEE